MPKIHVSACPAGPALDAARTLARGNPWAFWIWLEGLTDRELLALAFRTCQTLLT